MYQIYALYRRSRKILVFLLALCAVEVSIMAVLVGITMSELTRESKAEIYISDLISVYRAAINFNAYWMCLSRPTEGLSCILDPGPRF